MKKRKLKLRTKLNPEKKKTMEEILRVDRAPDERKVKITKNKFKIKKGKLKGKEIARYKVTIPKEYAELTNLDSEKFTMVFKCLNVGTDETPEYKVTAELIKNG